MRQIISSTNITLDGVTERLPEWHFGYMDQEAVDIVTADLFAADAVLMGRHTYEVFAQSWPARDGEFADRINAMKKYVVSSTLEDPQWSNTQVVRDPVTELAQLKKEAGGDIIMYGFGRVAKTLLDGQLLDEIRLFMHPVLAGGPGNWKDLLINAGAVGELELAEHRALKSGVMLLTYRTRKAS